eukprot:5885893-Ditylum_brightwellii.AAC.1
MELIKAGRDIVISQLSWRLNLIPRKALPSPSSVKSKPFDLGELISLSMVESSGAKKAVPSA